MQHSRYLCSFHIPKTGGTTFAGHARRLLSPEEFVLHGPFARADRFLGNQPQIEELPDSENQKIRIVHGHGAGLALAEVMRGRSPEFMVILRDPYARFVSGFHHYNSERKNSGRETIPEEKYFEKRSENFFARALLKHFGLLAPSNGKLSIENLMPILKSFKYILLTEYLDHQLPQICSLYGLKSNAIEARRINKSKYDLAVDRKSFDRRNDIDQTIYATLAAAAERDAASIDNPFGYNPDVVTGYLEAAWSNYNPETQLATAYDDLVEACRKTLKLQAALLKLTSGTVSHVADKQMLLDRVNAAVPDWLHGLGDKELSVANFWSGTMFVKEGNPGAAEQYFQEAIRLNPANDNALAHLAKLFHAQGNRGAAATYFNRAFELRPERPITQALRKLIGR